MLFAGGKLLTCFYSFMTALFAALIMVPFLRQWALDKDTVDLPDARKVHESPMPRLGGIAIFLAFLFSAIIYLPITQGVRGILAGSLIVFATGVVDDLNGLFSRGKFAGQAAACLVTIMVGDLYLSHLGNLFGFGEIILPAWIGIPFTVFAVVGVINAINLIDGLDGLAILPTVLVGTALGVIAYLTGHANFASYLNIPYVAGSGELVVFCGAIAGAGLGFLWFNTYPAQVFMGDVGALALGAALGTVAVITRHEIVFFIMGGIFVLETVSVIIQVASFKLTGKRVFRMAPIHHHYELKKWAENKIIVRFWMISFIANLLALISFKFR